MSPGDRNASRARSSPETHTRRAPPRPGEGGARPPRAVPSARSAPPRARDAARVAQLLRGVRPRATNLILAGISADCTIASLTCIQVVFAEIYLRMCNSVVFIHTGIAADCGIGVSRRIRIISQSNFSSMHIPPFLTGACGIPSLIFLHIQFTDAVLNVRIPFIARGAPSAGARARGVSMG